MKRLKPRRSVPIVASLLLALTAHAQGQAGAKVLTFGLPDLGVTLSGSPESLTIHNSTNKTVIGYLLLYFGSDPRGPMTALWQSAVRGTSASERIPAGESRPVNRPSVSMPEAPTSVHLDGVIFEDGEFAGPDTWNQFPEWAAGSNAEREFALAIARQSRGANTREAFERAHTRLASLNLSPSGLAHAHSRLRTTAESFDTMAAHGVDIASQAKKMVEGMPEVWRGNR